MGTSHKSEVKGRMVSVNHGLVFLITAVASASAYAVGNGSIWDEDCPFYPGSCPVTKDNVVDVFFFDVADRYSCQKHCKDIGECHFFTMFGIHDQPLDHMKCFLFKTCDYFEPCDECISGPEDPPIEECEDDNYICETERNNIIDVFYFDAEDDFSCH